MHHRSTISPTETSPSLDRLDEYLTEYVRAQQNDLLKRIESQSFRYQADICEQKLYQKLQTALVTITDQSSVEKLVRLRDSQLDTYENFVMFKARIREQCLPLPSDQLEGYVVPAFYWPSIKDQTLVETKIKCRKIVKQMKRDV